MGTSPWLHMWRSVCRAVFAFGIVYLIKNVGPAWLCGAAIGFGASQGWSDA